MKNQTMTQTPLELPRPLVNRILSIAQQNPEEEICGLISTINGIASNFYPVKNAAENRAERFEMDPSEQIAVMKKIRERGEQLLAIVHSHPHAPAIPSELDLKNNEYPELYYLIVSLNTRGVLELRCYQQHNDNFENAELTLEHED